MEYRKIDKDTEWSAQTSRGKCEIGKRKTNNQKCKTSKQVQTMSVIKNAIRSSNYKNSAKAIYWDILRLRARLSSKSMWIKYRSKNPRITQKLHIGCGSYKPEGWLNCDITDSDVDIDLANGNLPFPDEQFNLIVAQHVFEHLVIETELIPLLIEIFRCTGKSGEIVCSVPDIKKVTTSYAEDGGERLLSDRMRRHPNFTIGCLPKSQIVNEIFIQKGQHKNLFDLRLMSWTLRQAGFGEITQVDSQYLRGIDPTFRDRDDNLHTLYVSGKKK